VKHADLMKHQTPNKTIKMKILTIAFLIIILSV